MSVTNPVSFKMIKGILMVCLMMQVVCTKQEIRCIQSERQALLQFKATIDDDYGMLSSWTTNDCCQWKGIRCSNLTGHVLRLDLHGETDYENRFHQPYRITSERYIGGEIHKSLMELQQLQHLNLSQNSFQGSHIPEFFASLTNLRYLDLSYSDFGGKIPCQFGSLSHLKYLNLAGCSLEGSIPYQLGYLSNLQHLDLFDNSLEGKIPSQLGNLSNLQYLDLRYNSLNGNIPSQFRKLSNMQALYLGGYDSALKIDDGNHDGGQWLSNLTSLTHLYLWSISNLHNSHSWLQMIGKLPKLRELSLYNCSLSNHFILSLGPSKFNFSTSLSVLDLSWNAFTSPMIFQWVSNITSNLVELDLSGNFLDASTSNHRLATKMVKLPKLRELRLFDCNLSDNFLHSMTPSKFNFSTSLSILDLSSNSFTSSMILQWVSGIASNLVELDLSDNFLDGSISNHVATKMVKLPKLRELRLSDCNLSDNFLHSMTPSKFNFSTSLSILDLSSNAFTSSMIFQWVSYVSPNLIELDLSYNNLIVSSIPNHFGIMMNSLETLDLTDNTLKGGVMNSFMSICTMRSLNMFGNNLTEDLPSIFHNLSSGCVKNSLQELDLSHNKIIGSLTDLSVFSSLKTLDLSENCLSGKIPEGSKLPPHLESLSIRWNFLEGGVPNSFGSTCTLGSLDLSYNSLSEELMVIFNHLSGCSSLRTLYLDGNKINGTLSDFSNFSKLETLSLSGNRLSVNISKSSILTFQLELEGGYSNSFRNACTLRSLDLSNNNLSGELPMIIHHLSKYARYSLQYLDLSMNQISGTLPNFLSMVPSLRRLFLYGNKLNGTISNDVQFPTKLQELDLSSNSCNGSVTNSHLADMPKLVRLDLSDNPLALAFSQNWVPPFQLSSIALRSCKLGPTFPKWLQTQKNLQSIDISNAGISDIVPKWFWAKLALNEWMTMNISQNNLKGIISNLPLKNHHVSLSLASNQFEGPIPSFLRGSVFLDLSKNNFSSSFSFLCDEGIDEILYRLDLSHNHLFGNIPDCWSHFKSLAYLDLSHNKFSGKIPTSMGSLLELHALLLRNNDLTDKIPFSLSNCTKLVMLDMTENKLSGPIPAWIGSELHELQILSLGRNHFFGNLPLQICYLKSIQLLDLSQNNLSGKIPKCFKNFTAMAQKTSSKDFPGHYYFVNTTGYGGYTSYDLNAILMWKGVEQMFMNNEVSLLKSIDLSSNNYSGKIPTEIESLFELVSLNLSRNNLTGKIPSNIGNLASLEFLDLSRNQFVGSIPSSLTQIYRLAMLDLSHNHLSGQIPTSTQLQSFNASSYEDNLDLCGPPLKKLCIDGEPAQEPLVKIHEDENSLFTREFYMSMVLGFVISFWGVFGSILIKRPWRYAYFKFLNNLANTIYVMAAV